MTIARHYRLEAAPGLEEALHAALLALARTVASVPGCEAADLLRDSEQPKRFVLVEKWVSAEAHAASAAHLPKDAFAAVMAALAGKPEVARYDCLRIS